MPKVRNCVADLDPGSQTPSLFVTFSVSQDPMQSKAADSQADSVRRAGMVGVLRKLQGKTRTQKTREPKM